MAEKKKGDLNQPTKDAGLSFNVNAFKTHMKEYYSTLGLEQYNFKRGHIALSACNEALCGLIVNNVTEKIVKDKAGLYVITYDNMENMIMSNPDMRRLLREYIENFDENSNYHKQYCVTKTNLVTFIEHYNGNNLQLDNKAHNFLIYLLATFSNTVMKTAHMLVQYAHRQSVTIESIVKAVEVHCPSSIAKSLVIKIEEAVSAYSAKNDKEDDKEDKEEEESEEEAAEEPKETAKSTKTTTKSDGKGKSKDTTKETAKESKMKDTKSDTKGKSKDTTKTKKTKKAETEEEEDEASGEETQQEESEEEPEEKAEEKPKKKTTTAKVSKK